MAKAIMGEAIVATLVLVATVASPAWAIIRRHDVADAKYEEYGRRFRDPVVSLGIPDRNGAPRLYNGAGVLIAEHWVLTAAHAAEPIAPGGALNPFNRHSVYVRGIPRLIDAVFVSPRWKDAKIAGEDIALIRLKDPVAGVVPVGLYRGQDEMGKVLTVAGYGRPGDGVSGVAAPDAVFRAGQVTVDQVHASSLAWTFRGPTMRGVLPLEGISGPGDSGGPALIEQDGRLFTLGVSSTQQRNGQPEGTYGVREFYARVSHHAAWIDSVMRDNPGACQCPGGPPAR